jgi:signal transduction histidine kinase
LRVIKQNTLRYESFYKLLPYLNSAKEGGRPGYYPESEFVNPAFLQLNKLKELFEIIYSFQRQINEITDTHNIIQELENSVKKIIPCREINIYIAEDSKLLPLNDAGSEYSVNFINEANRKGILDWVFHDRTPKIIPDLKLYNVKGSKLNYIIFPLFSEKKNKGILSILSSLTSLTPELIENRVIHFLGSSAYSRIELIKKTKELNSAYHDQQIYQSKLINDYRLSAIGELTNGVAEEILSPLQVIISQVDFLRRENAEITETDYDTIKDQVKKVENIVNRLIKFASINNENIKIHPCDLNKLIRDYCNLLSSTLKNINYECYLDLADNLPHVLSHPDYIFQILANIFSIVYSNPQSETGSAGAEDELKSGGGVLIQSRFKDRKINVRIVFTDQIKITANYSKISRKNSKQNNFNDTIQYNLRIVDNLMKKHEGEFSLAGNDLNGSVIMLSFPLQRKIRL